LTELSEELDRTVAELDCARLRFQDLCLRLEELSVAVDLAAGEERYDEAEALEGEIMQCRTELRGSVKDLCRLRRLHHSQLGVVRGMAEGRAQALKSSIAEAEVMVAGLDGEDPVKVELDQERERTETEHMALEELRSALAQGLGAEVRGEEERLSSLVAASAAEAVSGLQKAMARVQEVEGEVKRLEAALLEKRVLLDVCREEATRFTREVEGAKIDYALEYAVLEEKRCLLAERQAELRGRSVDLVHRRGLLDLHYGAWLSGHEQRGQQQVELLDRIKALQRELGDAVLQVRV
jgi:hypothetical protein